LLQMCVSQNCMYLMYFIFNLLFLDIAWPSQFFRWHRFAFCSRV
jgi:hypothetical protein